MKTTDQNQPKQGDYASVERRTIALRGETKTTAHRYERRKIREQLRHLDWALAGVD